MKHTPSLDDFALFLAVADAGGLAGAAEATGVSAPTLSRRLTALERTLGLALFHRGKRGYALTADGCALLDKAEVLREAAATLRGFGQEDKRARVRITAGHLTSAFLAKHVHRFWTADDAWVPEFLACNLDLDIARRVADIGVRNRRPEQSWLAGRRTRAITYAEYAASPSVTGYIGASGDTTTPSSRWIGTEHDADVVTGASDARVALDLARAGLGRVALPTFIGESEPGLVRVSGTIAALAHDEWLVAHHEARHDPPVRAALDALAALLTDRSLQPPLP